jgi:glucosamine--fructose-6-phosphate aminotransferase (isomerizing)
MNDHNPFIDEINEQPLALENTLKFYSKGSEGADLLKNVHQFIVSNEIDLFTYTGMGSSFYNSQIPYYYLNAKGISCDVKDTGELVRYLTPSLYSNSKNKSPSNNKRHLLVAVSQSGESGEIVKLLQLSKTLKQNTAIWGITNNISSTLGKNASLVFPTIASSENSVTSKTYTTGLLVQYLLARAIAGDKPLTEDVIEQIKLIIAQLPPVLFQAKTLEYSYRDKIDEFMGNLNFINFIGTGPSMATVMQGTLNAKEIAKTYAEGITIDMFRHGPIETISKDFRAICCVSDILSAEYLNPILKNVTTKWGAGKVVLISNHPKTHDEILSNNVLLIPNPIQDPYLAPIYEIAIVQEYLCQLAVKKGFIPGEFRNTQKITK